MNKKQYFAYIRVSTIRQGEHGVSLQEQRDAIQRYADRFACPIGEWFEERETAAKRGRAIFTRMLHLLQTKKADGVIMHKIDRGARNLKDWSELQELLDRGVEVHFANEGIDLHSRGGRLSADIQAVVAADYIRNLREETKKGIYGRMKQGLYPLPAPIGYLDRGPGKLKEIDPVMGPLVKRAFALYATGTHTLESLAKELRRLGIRNKGGGVVTTDGLARILKNPFYIGVIHVRRNGKSFPGAHQPLIPSAVFERVQRNLREKIAAKTRRHDFLFRRMLRCAHCKYVLAGELKKGRVYYRCHTRECPTIGIREDRLEQEILTMLAEMRLSEEEKIHAEGLLENLQANWAKIKDEQIGALTLNMNKKKERLERLTDAYIDRAIERDVFEGRKTGLIKEQLQIKESIDALSAGNPTAERLSEFFELAGTAWNAYKLGLPDEKRELLEIMNSNLCVDGRSPVLMLVLPFQLIAKRGQNENSSPCRGSNRTLEEIFVKLVDFFSSNSLRPRRDTYEVYKKDSSSLI